MNQIFRTALLGIIGATALSSCGLKNKPRSDIAELRPEIPFRRAESSTMSLDSLNSQVQKATSDKKSSDQQPEKTNDDNLTPKQP